MPVTCKISNKELEHYLTFSQDINSEGKEVVAHVGIQELYEYLFPKNPEDSPSSTAIYAVLGLEYGKTTTIKPNYPNLDENEELLAQYNRIRSQYGLNPVRQVKAIEDEVQVPIAPLFKWTKRTFAVMFTAAALYTIGESFVAYLGERSTGFRAFNDGVKSADPIPKPPISNPDIATWGHPAANFLIGIVLKPTAIFSLFKLGVRSTILGFMVFCGMALFNLTLAVGGTFLFGNIQQKAASHQGYIHGNDTEASNLHSFWAKKFPSDIPEQGAIMGLALLFGYMLAAGAYLTYRMCAHQETIFNNGKQYNKLINA